jgi:hypothetical protein
MSVYRTQSKADMTMTADEFERRIAELLPEYDRSVLQSYIKYGEELAKGEGCDDVDRDLTYLEDLCTEFAAVKQTFDTDIALQTFRISAITMLNSFEVKRAAQFLQNGCSGEQTVHFILYGYEPDDEYEMEEDN